MATCGTPCPCVSFFVLLCLMRSVHATGICSVLPSRNTLSAPLRELNLSTTLIFEADAECCNACAMEPSCTHWTRSTISSSCILRQGAFSGDFADASSRLGFRGQNQLLCSLVKLAYGILGDIVKLVPISLGQTIKNFRVELPNTLQCTAAATHELKLVDTAVVLLRNMTVIGHGDFDIKAGPLAAAGTSQIYIKATPEVSIDFDTCKVTVATPGIWDLGIGVDNLEEGWQWLTNWMSGKFHAGFKSAADCGGPMPALPGRAQRHPAGTIDHGEFDLYELSQVERDQHCCRACAERSDCEAFEISDKDGPRKTNKCKLKQVSVPSKKRVPTHANFRGNATALRGELLGMDGVIVGQYKLLFTNQTDFDAQCSALCDEIDTCETWTSSVGGGIPKHESGNCWLAAGTIPRGLINSGIFGLSGRVLIDWLGNYLFKGLLTKVLQRMCSRKDELQHFLDIDFAVVGNGVVDLDVGEDFLASFSDDASAWGKESFPVLQRQLTNLSTTVVGLKAFTDDLLGDFGGAFAGDLAQQIAAPVAFYLGGILTRCARDGSRKCGTGTVDELTTGVFV